MNKLTPIFIGGAILVSAGLAIAQNQGGGADVVVAQAQTGGAMGGMSGMDHSNMPGMTMGAPADAAASPSTQAYIDANTKMHADMGVKFTGDADIDFMLAMIPHHQGAIDMAKIELQYGKDPQVRALAEEVIKAQEAEIAEMKEWLAARGQ